MCRLFGLSGGPLPIRATFWLLEAPDSLAQQSRRNPDGTGLGYYDPTDEPVVVKQPLAAYEDHQFAQEAREVRSRTFVAHVRYASGTPLTLRNTHPFVQADRLFAHNGVIGDLPTLERHLGDGMSMVGGETDSERYFALITKEIARTGDVAQGLTAAVEWIAENLPVFALNCVLTTAHEVWALRYPDVHELHVLERKPGGPSGQRHLEHASARGSLRVRSGDLIKRPAVIVASERMDEDPGWRALEPGELLHIAPNLETSVRRVIDRPPTHQLTLADLDAKAAESQAPASRAERREPPSVSTSLIYRSALGYELLMRALYGRHYAARMRAVAELVPEGASVLELCCGPGTLYTRQLRGRVRSYIGLDVNPGFVAGLQRHGADARLIDLAQDNAPLPGADVALMQASLYHFLPDAGGIVERMLNAAHDRVIVSEPVRNLASSANPLIARLGRRAADPGVGGGERRFTEATLDELFSRYAGRVLTARLIPGGREKLYVVRAG